MLVKFNRGPKAGEYGEARDSDYMFRVVVPNKERLKAPWLDGDSDTLAPALTFRTGEYHKSHRRLKGGAVVFEWMGWTDGKP